MIFDSISANPELSTNLCCKSHLHGHLDWHPLHGHPCRHPYHLYCLCCEKRCKAAGRNQIMESRPYRYQLLFLHGERRVDVDQTKCNHMASTGGVTLLQRPKLIMGPSRKYKTGHECALALSLKRPASAQLSQHSGVSGFPGWPAGLQQAPRLRIAQSP